MKFIKTVKALLELPARLDAINEGLLDINERLDGLKDEQTDTQRDVENMRYELVDDARVSETETNVSAIEDRLDDLGDAIGELISQRRVEELLEDYVREDDDRVVLAATLQECFTNTLDDIPGEERERRHAGLARKSDLDALRTDVQALTASLQGGKIIDSEKAQIP